MGGVGEKVGDVVARLRSMGLGWTSVKGECECEVRCELVAPHYTSHSHCFRGFMNSRLRVRVSAGAVCAGPGAE